MKKYFLVVIIPIISFNSEAQKCKYEKNELDEFTKNYVVITKRRSLYQYLSNVLTMKGVMINDNKYLRAEIGASGIFSVDKGDKLMFILGDGSVLELKSVEYVIADHKTHGFYGAVADYYIDPEKFQLLSNYKITKVRIYTTDGYIEKKIKQDYQYNVSFLLNCLNKGKNKKF